MDVTLYLKRFNADGYIALDLFKDEKIEINLQIKNLTDISKVRTDFTQNFTIPCSDTNNKMFDYWYSGDVLRRDDSQANAYNANIRVDAYIEVNSTPFRYGSLQLDSAKLKNGVPNSYSVTFFGAGVGLSDKFGEDELKDLFQNIQTYDHVYNANVIQSLNTNYFGNNSVYYPLISAKTYLKYGTSNDFDLNLSTNTINYKDFKPALRIIRIIEAIEQKYNLTFSRDFFDRAIFYNLFMWLHRDADRLLPSSTPLSLNFTSLTVNQADWGLAIPEINITTDSVAVNWSDNFPTNVNSNRIFISLKIITSSPYKYKIEVFDNNILYNTYNNLQYTTTTIIYLKQKSEDNNNHLFTFRLTAIEEQITFTSSLLYQGRRTLYNIYNESYYLYRTLTATGASQTTANSIVKISEQIPNIKVKDFFNSLIIQFNLILKSSSSSNYYVDTLDNWYSKGKSYDISNLIDLKDITVNKSKAKKFIEFKYQKAEAILGKQYFENNQIGYGDLKADFQIQGDELKMESKFENMMFERVVNNSTSVPTDYQCGFAIDKSLAPVKTAPLVFYRNGFDTGGNIYIKTAITPSPVNATFTSTWHTATEDNKVLEQVTNTLNFGADNSTYFYQPLTNSLYYNFWQTYIEDLYNKQTRVLNVKGKMPIRILQRLGLNDRFIIGQKKYKISSLKVDLTTSQCDIEVFSDFSVPFDSYDDTISLRVDSTDYTVDSELLSVDADSIHLPITSYIINGVSLTEYNATKGEEHFEVKIDSNTNWTATPLNNWITVNKTTGNSSDYIRVSIAINTGSARSGDLKITIGTTDFNIDINQL
jgi:hypothetical protein